MMDRRITEQAIGLILTEIGIRLGEAARIAKAAEACALASRCPRVAHCPLTADE